VVVGSSPIPGFALQAATRSDRPARHEAEDRSVAEEAEPKPQADPKPQCPARLQGQRKAGRVGHSIDQAAIAG